jgi:translation elongation factor EF-Tu-like GTPase
MGGKRRIVAPLARPRQSTKMENHRLRIEARIHFLSTEEGGRRSPLQGGGSYRPNHNFFGPDNREMCVGSIDLAEGEQVAPGDTIEKALTLWIFPSVGREIQEGREWRIQEGGKLVATGTIMRVLDRQS